MLDRVSSPTAPREPSLAIAREPENLPLVITDVWSRPQAKYRWRAGVLLVLNFLLFCAVCAFSHWLHTARIFDFSLEGYLTPFRFWGDATQNLTDFLLDPINVVQNPIHGVVLGLLVAAMVATPIAVAILYRFWACLPFTAAVLVFAHMPWMAITLTLSCVLAAVRPFRLKLRFAAALVGLLPVLLYLYLATRPTDDQAALLAIPGNRTLLFAPWILALLAAAVMLGAILWLSSVVRYRPGAVAPILTGMLAAPVWLFFSNVGVDELEYRRLEAEVGPRSVAFRPVVDVTAAADQLFHEYTPSWSELYRVIQGDYDYVRRRLEQHFLVHLHRQREFARVKCEEFIERHPRSRHLSQVLYIQGLALDTRLDVSALFADQGLVARKLYHDFPHPESERVWSLLLGQFPDSPLALAAALRLGQLKLRAGEIGAARDVLRRGVDLAQQVAEAGGSVSDGLNFDADWYAAELRRQLSLIKNNADDFNYGLQPLQAYAQLDGRRAGYRDQLSRLLATFPKALLRDNLLVAYATSADSVDARAAQLRAFIDGQPTPSPDADSNLVASDALPEALFRLAGLEIQSLREPPDARRRGLERMRRLAQQYADTIWGGLAAEQLEQLEPAVALPAVTTQESP